MRAVVISMCVVLLGLTACRSDAVELRYRFPEEGEQTYRLHAVARAEWDIGERGTGSYDVVFRVTETVVEVDGDEAVVNVVMTPTRVRESGLPSPGSEERTFTLRVDATGTVVEVLDVQGVPAAQLDPAEVAFIGTYRPPLPREAQHLKDEWSDLAGLGSDSVDQQLRTRGRLDRLDRDDDGRFAALEFTGRGPLLYATELVQGEAELSGTSITSIDAELDLDRGYLRRARSSITGTFDVSVLPLEGAQPLEGKLRLELDLRLDNLRDP